MLLAEVVSRGSNGAPKSLTKTNGEVPTRGHTMFNRLETLCAQQKTFSKREAE